MVGMNDLDGDEGMGLGGNITGAVGNALGLKGKLMQGLQALGGRIQQGIGGQFGSGSDTQNMMRMMMLQNVLRNNMVKEPGNNIGESLSSLLPMILMGMGGKQPMSGTTGFGADTAGLPPGSLLMKQNLQQQMQPPMQQGNALPNAMNPSIIQMLRQQQQGGMQ